jgi:hypothetical protein
MSKSNHTDEARREALLEIAGRGRDIVTEECANRLLEPFGLTARGLGIAYETGEDQVGLDFGAGVERWGSGWQVDISTLAWKLATELDAPEVDYPTDYTGTGKRAAAITTQSVLRLRALAGETIPACEDCGTADVYPDGLCWSCQKERGRKQTMVEVWRETFPAKYTSNAQDVSGRTKYEVAQMGHGDVKDAMPAWWDMDFDAVPDVLERFYWIDLDIAVEKAREANAALGLIGPVFVRDTTRWAV